ncbi:MAG TPA: hypothetical protein EYP56_22630 [Planctomycetaceae bacterium]|nr:hypothetical protein [Planctomycetaceae bacterium]HIQ21172.1 hypothetical protein [Planctomycetota bacterium]
MSGCPSATDAAPADFVASGTLVADETVDYTYDSNERLLTATKDEPGTADDRFTEYAYDATQQTHGTVCQGLASGGVKDIETYYGYNLQGPHVPGHPGYRRQRPGRRGA